MTTPVVKQIFFTLITIAIISMTLSPACAFISGKYGNWIEICNSIGIVKIQDNTQDEIPDVTNDSCPFCFQHAHIGMNVIDLPALTGEFSQTWIGGFYNQSALFQCLKAYHATAPPVFS